jgi:hypothetical protein
LSSEAFSKKAKRSGAQQPQGISTPVTWFATRPAGHDSGLEAAEMRSERSQHIETLRSAAVAVSPHDASPFVPESEYHL